MNKKNDEIVEQATQEVIEGDLETHREEQSKNQIVGYSGPLPDAESFRRYENVLPGAADRILTMAEKEQQRHMESQNQFTKLEEKRISTVKTVSILTLLVSVYAMYLGHGWIAITGLGVSLLAAISRFFLLKVSVDKE